MRPAAAGTVAAQAKAFDEIVDVREVIEDPPVAENDEPAAGDAAKQLEQPAIAGTVDARGPRDHDLDAGPRAASRAMRSPFELRVLIDVARPERRVFVRRRMLDVAVNADGAAVDDASRAAALARRSMTVPTAAALTARYSSSRKPGLPIDRGDVVDDLGAVGRARQRIGVAKIALHDRDAVRASASARRRRAEPERAT